MNDRLTIAVHTDEPWQSIALSYALRVGNYKHGERSTRNLYPVIYNPYTFNVVENPKRVIPLVTYKNKHYVTNNLE